ncbi:branched-chain amino acid ABC transporter permease [Shinella sp.]|uniref:branched-chain amino acid ABC transporter permease n=1 Tax=Shinella sp. TaxID=1870904 RepID=UPI0039E496D1
MHDPAQGFGARFFLPLALSLILAGVAVGTALTGSGQLSETVGEMMIRMVVVVGMYIFIGNSGVLSFGHISFMSIGAYATAWVTCCTLPMVKPLYLPGLPEWLQTTSFPFPVGVLTGAALTALVALVVGFVLMRLSGIGASIGTFALLGMQFSVYSNWESVTAGSSSISNIPVVVGPGVATLFAIGAVWVAYAYQSSRFCMMLRATRDDPVAAQASGVSILPMRLVAFVLSAAVVGVGGVLYGNFLGILSILGFYIATTFLCLSMLIIGGIGSLSGAVLGVLVVSVVVELLRLLERGADIGAAHVGLPLGTQEVGLGILMILVLIFRPSGLTRGREIAAPRRLAHPLSNRQRA